MTMIRTRLDLRWLLALAIAVTGLARADLKLRDDWKRFENDHFIAYSDDKEKRVISLLEELERFRSAFLQISVISVPEDAPKTLVLILRRKSDFSAISYTGGLGGFAQNIGGRTVIVMPAKGNPASAESVIKHELGHALLNYKDFRYPTWFSEGFAEFVSSVEVDPDENSFSLGAVPPRAEVGGNMLIDWDDLLDEHFDPHSLNSSYMGSMAYTQSWLLVHYMVLGDKGKNAPKLQHYFSLVEQGTNSSEAFERSLGMEPDDVWDRALKAYVRNLPVYTVTLQSNNLDLGFEVTPVSTDEVRPMIGYYENLASAHRDPDYLRDPMAHVGGSWGLLEFGASCRETMRMHHDPATSTLFWVEGDGGKLSDLGEFTYSTADDTTLKLASLDYSGDQGTLTGLGWTMRMPTRDLVCLQLDGLESRFCTMLFERCDQ